MTRRIHGAKNYVENTFGYSIEQDPGNPAVIEDFPAAFEVELSGNVDMRGNIANTGGPDLAGYEFTTLGDYKFIVREESSSDPINYPIVEDRKYYFYVSVRNKLDSDGRPTGEYVATMANQVRDHDTGDKMAPDFETDAVRSRVEVTNTVSGNMANIDEYFKYRVVIEGAREGDIYTVYGQPDVVNYHGANYATSKEVSIDGVDDYIYLKHGQTVYIGFDGENNELPVGVTYHLEEVDGNGYAQYVDGVAGAISADKTVAAEENAASNKVAFLNHKESDVLTGIVTNVMPYAFAVGFTGAALAIARASKKKWCRVKCSR